MSLGAKYLNVFFACRLIFTIDFVCNIGQFVYFFSQKILGFVYQRKFRLVVQNQIGFDPLEKLDPNLRPSVTKGCSV